MALMRLVAERECDMFKRRLYGMLTLLDQLDNDLLNPDKPVSSDMLMWLHFDKDRDALQIVLGNPELRQAFVEFYPTMGHLLEAGDDLCVELAKLHAIREELIVPHLRQDGRDLMREVPESPNKLTDDDLAGIYGLSRPQWDAYRANLDRKGFMYLSMTERKRLYDAIQAAFASVEDELGPVNT